MSVASEMSSRSLLCNSSFASPADSVSLLWMYSQQERLMSLFVALQAARYWMRSWSDLVRRYRRSSRLLLRLASMASLDNQLCRLRRLVTDINSASSLRIAMTLSRSWTAYSFVVALGQSQILLASYSGTDWCQCFRIYDNETLT